MADAPPPGVSSTVLPVQAGDGHRFELIARLPAEPRARLLWLPALGVAAWHYLPLADYLAAHGVAVFLHEWRGNGSSNLRAGPAVDWGYRELLTGDLPASEAAIAAAVPGIGPKVIGGHSLGGQLATCHLALAPDAADVLWLVASGSPHWRAFPPPLRQALPLAYRFLPWLADRCGALPGPRIGFGGREARGVMRDWSRSALTGRYAARGVDCDVEAGFREVTARVQGVTLARDWMAPRSSLAALLAKLPRADVATSLLDDASAGVRSDHFAWMRHPQGVGARLLASLDARVPQAPPA